MKRQPNQHAAVLIPGKNVQLIKVASLRELPVTERQCEEFRKRSMEAAGCYKTPEQARVELTKLEDRLLLEARTAIVIETEKSSKITPIEAKTTARTIWNLGASPAKTK